MGLISKAIGLVTHKPRVSTTYEKHYTRPANANALVVNQLKAPGFDGKDLKKVDLALREWGFTNAKATDPAVQKMVANLGSMTPGKDQMVRDAVQHLKTENLPENDANALMDAIRMTRAKNFINTVAL